LRAYRKWQRSRRTAEKSDELAPSHLPPLRLKATHRINPHDYSGRGRAERWSCPLWVKSRHVCCKT